MNVSAASAPMTTPTSLRDVVERVRARSRATGALVMTGFGALWAGMGVAGPLMHGAVALMGVALVLVAVQVFRRHPAVVGTLPPDLAERRRRGSRVLTWACVGEGVGILLAINVVVNMGHPQWQPAAIMAVVGLHFLPLAVGFRYRPHAVTGIALTAWAFAYPWLFGAGAMAPAGPLVAGAMLFASAAWALRPAVRG